MNASHSNPGSPDRKNSRSSRGQRHFSLFVFLGFQHRFVSLRRHELWIWCTLIDFTLDKSDCPSALCLGFPELSLRRRFSSVSETKLSPSNSFPSPALRTHLIFIPITPQREKGECVIEHGKGYAQREMRKKRKEKKMDGRWKNSCLIHFRGIVLISCSNF